MPAPSEIPSDPVRAATLAFLNEHYTDVYNQDVGPLLGLLCTLGEGDQDDRLSGPDWSEAVSMALCGARQTHAA